ncbi:Hypothetical_protein [Hexamita inflata]|uniref:Hypothetical_protein n=1 Tax=Hexamita inflata TaxID=28002 RepID=A0AA86VLB5_9EUKA|nr:Hypothetical protein HINF_LOCUS57618 [Hexamita inflata]
MSQALVQCRDKHIYLQRRRRTRTSRFLVLQIVIVPVWAYCCDVSSCWAYLGRLNLSHIFTSIMQSQNTESPNQERIEDLESCGQPCTQSTSVCTPAAFYAAQLLVVRFCSLAE